MNLAGIGMAVLLLPLCFLTASSNQVARYTDVAHYTDVTHYTDLQSVFTLVVDMAGVQGGYGEIPGGYGEIPGWEWPIKIPKNWTEKVWNATKTVLNATKTVLNKTKEIIPTITDEAGKVVLSATKVVTNVVKGTYEGAKKVFGKVVDALENVVMFSKNTGDVIVEVATGVIKNAENAVAAAETAVAAIGGKTLQQITEAFEKSGVFNRVITTSQDLIEFIIETDKNLAAQTNITFSVSRQFIMLSYQSVRKFTVDAYQRPLAFLVNHAIIPTITASLVWVFASGTFVLLPVIAAGVLVSIILLFIKGLISHLLINYDQELYDKLKCYASTPFVATILAILEFVVGMFLFSSIMSKLGPQEAFTELDINSLSGIKKWAAETARGILNIAKKMLFFLSEKTIKGAAFGVYTVVIQVIKAQFIPEPDTDPCETIGKLTNNTGNLTEEYAANVLEATVTLKWPEKSSE